MKQLLCVLSFLTIFQHTLFAADFGQHWIYAETDTPSTQIWFRNTYLASGHARQANIRMVTGGKFLLYVNERIVSSDVITHAPSYHEITMDVTRFLRPDSNIIAVWYAPTIITESTEDTEDTESSHHQLSLTFYGTDANHAPFSYHTGSDWQYAPAHANTSPTTETQDARQYAQEWKSISTYTPMWRNAAESNAATSTQLYDDGWIYDTYRMSHIYQFLSFDDHGNTVTYRFGKSFDGWVRLTLRDMARGDTVQVNGLTYICNGETDEQACQRFRISSFPSGIAIITSNRADIRQHINQIEGIEIKPFLHTSYLY